MQTDRTWDVVTALDVCVDLIVTGDTTPRFGQAEQFVDGYALEMGGSCAIFAAQCAKLGKRTLGLGVRGADAFGDVFEHALKRQGVDLSLLRTDPDQKTGLGIALVRHDDRAILTYNGTIDALTGDAFPDSLLSACRHLHIGSYYLMKRLAPAWPDIARRAKALGMTVSLDANWDPEERWQGLDELLPHVDVFLPNEQELAALGGTDKLLRLVPLVAVKRGAQGASVYTADSAPYHQDAFDVTRVDAIGAGDSFDAGFVYAWTEGLPLPACLAVGCACGSLSVRAAGGTAGQGTRREVACLVGQRGFAFGGMP